MLTTMSFYDKEPTDFEYVMATLGMAWADELTLDDIHYTVCEANNGKEFDAGVYSIVLLKDIQSKVSNGTKE